MDLKLRCKAPYGSCNSQVYQRDSDGQVEMIYCNQSDEMNSNSCCDYSNFNCYNKNRPTTTS